jgi:DNA-binding transcriptional MocR family regulator
MVRSVSKSLGPDLRLAALTGDELTVGRVRGRQLLATGWVSQILQRAVVRLWSDPGVERLVARAATTYAERREALISALAGHGVAARGASGLNVWVPVRDELRLGRALLEAGWAVSAGERYRIESGPAIRITISSLEPPESPEIAAEIARALAPAGSIRAY